VVTLTESLAEPQELAEPHLGKREATIMEIKISESDRQAILLALAHTAVERPGWDYMLNELAKKMDNVADDRAVMYETFKAIRQHRLFSDVLVCKRWIFESQSITNLLMCPSYFSRRNTGKLWGGG
jgi:hypothetical protein